METTEVITYGTWYLLFSLSADEQSLVWQKPRKEKQMLNRAKSISGTFTHPIRRHELASYNGRYTCPQVVCKLANG